MTKANDDAIIEYLSHRDEASAMTIANALGRDASDAMTMMCMTWGNDAQEYHQERLRCQVAKTRGAQGMTINRIFS